MSIIETLINLFTHLNVTDGTKYFIIISVIIGIFMLCMMNGKKKKDKKDHKIKKSLCKKNYMKCIKENIRNNTNNFCYPCLNSSNNQSDFVNNYY